MARSREDEAPAEHPLPRGIRECLKRQPRPRNGDNLGLWLDKFLPLNNATFGLNGEQRDRILGDLFIAREVGKTVPWRSDATREILVRQRETCTLLYGQDHFREYTAELRGRLLIDYARLSTIESSLSFHATLGVPRIPGSALKGLLRASLRPLLTARDLAELFGAPDLEAPKSAQTIHSRGHLIFHDALPVDGQFQLDLDVLTPHYRNYYEGNGKVPPSDWLSPIPHGFLTVVQTTFRVVLGLSPSHPNPEQTFKTLEQALRETLWQEGLGAKRSAGYGRLVLNPT